MKPRASARMGDRIQLSRLACRPPLRTRRAPLFTLIGGLIGSAVLFWIMVQLGQASSEAKPTARPAASPATGRSSTGSANDRVPPTEPEESEQALAPPALGAHGPALETPREILDMLDLRRRDLDRREEAVRQSEERLLMIKAEIEQLLTRNEALEKRMQQARAKRDQQVSDLNAQLERARQLEAQKNQHQAQLAKMYESMSPEEAAARLERMPDRKAVEILRLVKGKTAGAILAQVKVDRAAKLTELLLTHAP